MTETDAVFASTVDHYARFRSGYPPDRIADLAVEIGLDDTRWLLDVGCGSGQVAVPMASHCRAVVAIDPVPTMLDHGRRAARHAGVDNINWRLGHSRDLGQVEPGAQAAIFAASFHWTDREEVLRVLDHLLVPEGSVVVITDGLADDDLPDWDLAIAEIRRRYLGPEPPHLDAHLHPVRSSSEVLAESPFSRVSTRTWVWERSLTVDEVVGLQLSYSFSSPALLGEHQRDFVRDVREVVLALHSDGVVVEPLRATVHIATRPGAVSSAPQSP